MVGRKLRSFLLFCGLGVVVYANALDNPFHYDDLHSIKFNPHIRRLSAIPSYFTDPGTFSGRREGFMFRPLLLLSYALNYAYSGQQVDGYRVVNLLLHVLCTTALWRVLLRLTGDGTAALAGALLFLLHPLHAEPINYISARSDVLCAAFYLWALVGALSDTRARRLGALLLYVAALLSKSVAITFPLAWLILSLVHGGWKRVRREAPYHLGTLLVSAAYLVVIWSNHYLTESLAKAPRGLAVQSWTQVKALVYYLKLTFFPVPLTVEHPFSVASGLADGTVVVAAAFELSLLVVVLGSGRGLLRAGVLLFGLVLAPASLMPLNILVSERRAYLALCGLSLLLAWMWRERGRVAPAIRWGSVFLGGLFALLSWQRNIVWRSDIALWEEAVAQTPATYRARMNMGLAYAHDGRLDEALVQLRAGLALEDDNAETWVTLGNIQRARGDIPAAEQAYLRALELNPGLAGVYHNLGNIAFIDRGDPERAVALYEQGLELDGHLVQARTNLGQALERLGRDQAARAQYEQAVRDSLYWDSPADPELGGTWLNLAALRERCGQLGAAHAAYARAYAILRPCSDLSAWADRAAAGARRTGEQLP